MKVIDARTGQEVVVGQTVTYDDDEGITLLELETGLWSARARVRRIYRDPRTTPGGFRTSEAWIPLQVRWTHPRYFLQHVAFIPS